MQKKITLSKGDRVFTIVNYIILALLLALFLYPLYFVVIASISDPNAIWRGEVILWPKEISWIGYEEILRYTAIWQGYLNSLFYTVIGLLVNMTMTVLGAYALSRKDFMLRGVFMKLFLFTMFFSGGLIPSFILIKDLQLYNTLWSLILPGAVSTYNMIIMRAFFSNSLPEELRESAMLDGCGEFQYLFKIALPLSKAVLAVIALYYGLGHWNSYFSAMIYLEDRNMYPLQLVLREIILRTTSIFEPSGDEATIAYLTRLAEVVKYCAIIVASVPPLLVYPFVQKSFVKGVMIGSVKG